MKNLHSWRVDGVSLVDALKAFDDRHLTGFMFSPAAFGFAACDKSVLKQSGVSLDQVYEARLFDRDVELRWLRDAANKDSGTAVCVSEREADKPSADGFIWIEQVPLAVFEDSDLFADSDSSGKEINRKDDRLRLMTGTVRQQRAADGWAKMDTPRHGCIDVPISGDGHGLAAFVVREYLGYAQKESAGNDGNLIVVEERFLAMTCIGANGEAA